MIRRLLADLRADMRVDLVQYDAAWRRQLSDIIHFGERMLAVLAVLLGVATLLVIGNTVRMDIQARSDEISVMQLIGASNGFVRRPFLYSGLWYGLLGGVFALARGGRGRTRSGRAARSPARQLRTSLRVARRRRQRGAGRRHRRRAARLARRVCGGGAPSRRGTAARMNGRHCADPAHRQRRAASAGRRRLARRAPADRARAEGRAAALRGDRLRAAAPRRARCWRAAWSTWSPPRCACRTWTACELARQVREHSPQAYIPIVVVSGDVQERLVARALSQRRHRLLRQVARLRGAGGVHPRLRAPESDRQRRRALRRGQPRGRAGDAAHAREDGFSVTHVVTVEDALELLESARGAGHAPGADLVLTDVNLKGELSGGDLLERVRNRVRLYQGRVAGAGHDRRRQSGQPGRAAARRRQRPGAQADRGTPADHQAAVPAARRPPPARSAATHRRETRAGQARRRRGRRASAREFERPPMHALGDFLRAEKRAGKIDLSARRRASSRRSTRRRSMRSRW